MKWVLFASFLFLSACPSTGDYNVIYDVTYDCAGKEDAIAALVLECVTDDRNLDLCRASAEQTLCPRVRGFRYVVRLGVVESRITLALPCTQAASEEEKAVCGQTGK